MKIQRGASLSSLCLCVFVVKMQRQEIRNPKSAIRNPKSAIRNSTGSPCIRVLHGREKKCIAGFQPAKVVLTQKELSRLRWRRDAGATIFSHDPCLRGE